MLSSSYSQTAAPRQPLLNQLAEGSFHLQSRAGRRRYPPQSARYRAVRGDGAFHGRNPPARLSGLRKLRPDHHFLQSRTFAMADTALTARSAFLKRRRPEILAGFRFAAPPRASAGAARRGCRPLRPCRQRQNPSRPDLPAKGGAGGWPLPGRSGAG